MTAVSIKEAKAKLSELIHKLKPGDEVVITENNAPVARLVPLAQATPRVAGLHAGTISTSDDFDEPLPEDFWTGTA